MKKKKIEKFDYTKGNNPITPEQEKLAWGFLEEILKLDIDNLISKNISFELKPSGIWIDSFGLKRSRSSNYFKLYLKPIEGGFEVWPQIECSSRSMYFIRDTVELGLGLGNYNTKAIIKNKKSLKEVSKFIITMGYSVWCNKWGYPTKEGRRCRGRLGSMYGLKVPKLCRKRKIMFECDFDLVRSCKGDREIYNKKFNKYDYFKN